MKTGVFVGRFQPFHEGHKKCVEHILEQNDRCLIMVRDTEKSDKNPYVLEERIARIMEAFPDTNNVLVQPFADPGADLTIYIGRDVGYKLIQLDASTEAFSATDIRKKMCEEKD